MRWGLDATGGGFMAMVDWQVRTFRSGDVVRDDAPGETVQMWKKKWGGRYEEEEMGIIVSIIIEIRF